jgi:hypothetical protein
VSWLRRSSGDDGTVPADGVVRLTKTSRFPSRVAEESAALTDAETVRQWVRELGVEADQQVHVRRAWGAVAAVYDGENPVTVVLADREHAWTAEPPGTAHADLTLEQVEQVVLDALTSAARPQWPTWRPLE